MKALVLMLVLLAGACSAGATPLQPARDDEVIERLPPAPPRIGTARRANPARQALRLVEAARRDGDPRRAGQALALLRPWRDDDGAHADIVVALAQAEQYLHEFDAARERLQRLVEREPGQAQAWLMLATLHRVQGRYAAADDACAGLARAGAALHASACRAENDALRGDRDGARHRLRALLAAAHDRSTAAWLWTTLAELEQRDGRADAAERAFRAALDARPDAYAAIAYADLLIAQGRGQDARAALLGLPDSDAALLRIALADPTDATGRAAADELRRRHAQADLRPGGSQAHARERALFALRIERDAQTALRLAQANVRTQREPIDLRLLVCSARAAGDDRALEAAHRLIRETALEDRRLDAPC